MLIEQYFWNAFGSNFNLLVNGYWLEPCGTKVREEKTKCLNSRLIIIRLFSQRNHWVTLWVSLFGRKCSVPVAYTHAINSNLYISAYNKYNNRWQNIEVGTAKRKMKQRLWTSTECRGGVTGMHKAWTWDLWIMNKVLNHWLILFWWKWGFDLYINIVI